MSLTGGSGIRPVASSQRLPRAGTACGAGMNSPRDGIFLRSPMAVMDSVRPTGVRGSGAGGRAMRERGARVRRPDRAGRPRQGRRRRGPAGDSGARAESVGSASRSPERPRETAWGRAPKGGCGRRAGGNGGPGRARCVRRGGRGSISPEKPIGCRAIQVLRNAPARGRLARDNYCYQEPIRQFHRFRRAAPRPPNRAPTILGSRESNFNPLD